MSGPHSQPPWASDPAKQPLVPPQVKEIATQLFQRIATERYPFGTRIPAERDLAEEFSATRATIRLVLDFLETYGVVSRRPGSGTFVLFRSVPEPAPSRSSSRLPGHHQSIDQLAETASPFALSIAGSVLEPEMVRLATIYMSTRDLAELRQQLSELEAIVTEADRFAALEDQFMMTIARGTHNALIVAMYEILHEVRRHPSSSATRRQTLTPAKIRKTQQLLNSLFKAIETRNVETAVELITLHVSTAHEEMIYEPQ